MKVIGNILILSIILFSSCNQKGKDYPQLTFNDSACIKIVVKDTIDPLIIKARFNSTFPFQPCLTRQLDVNKQGDYYIYFQITKPELAEITIQDKFYSYIIPKDTLIINVGNKSGIKDDSLVYIEIDDPIYLYLNNEIKKFGHLYFEDPSFTIHFNKYATTPPTSLKEMDIALKNIDSLARIRLDFFEKNKNGLPSWFIDMQMADYIYFSAVLKYRQYYYMSNWDLKGEYPQINAEIYNPKAKLSSQYYRFILDYFFLPQIGGKNNKLTGPARYFELYNKSSDDINSSLKNEILNYLNFGMVLSNYNVANSTDDLTLVDNFSHSNNFCLDDGQEAFINKARVAKSDYINNMKSQTEIQMKKLQNLNIRDTSGLN